MNRRSPERQLLLPPLGDKVEGGLQPVFLHGDSSNGTLAPVLAFRYASIRLRELGPFPPPHYSPWISPFSLGSYLALSVVHYHALTTCVGLLPPSCIPSHAHNFP